MNNVQHVIWPKYCYRKMYSRTPLIRTLVIRITKYPDLLGPSGKHFLTVIVLHIFWLKFFPHLLNTYKELMFYVYVNKYTILLAVNLLQNCLYL